MATTRHVVAKVGEIPLGGKKLISVKGRDIGVFNVNGEFFALLNKCPHAGASLCHGRIIGLAEADEPGQYRLSRKGEIPAARVVQEIRGLEIDAEKVDPVTA